MSTTTPLPTWTLEELLTKARREARLSKEQMAEVLGVSLKTINNYEGGRTHPNRATLRVWIDTCKLPWFTLDGIRDLLGPDSRWITDPAVQLTLFHDDESAVALPVAA